MHVSEEDKSSEEVSTERVVVNSEPTTNEGASSQATTTLPETVIGLNEGTMRKNNFEDRRVQCLEEVIDTVTKEGEPEVVSRLEVVETTNEVEDRRQTQ